LKVTKIISFKELSYSPSTLFEMSVREYCRVIKTETRRKILVVQILSKLCVNTDISLEAGSYNSHYKQNFLLVCNAVYFQKEPDIAVEHVP
jgi:hypothetical protein